ncbi:MAG: DUF177 domain-containing protein [Clostridiales bacterium]|nr:DUF177 domain-containing protein [Clostridiales bacterium]
MKISLFEICAVDGRERDYTCEIEMKAFSSPDGDYDLIQKEPVTLHIVNTGDQKLEITGRLRLSLSVPCSRCLEPVEVPFDLDIEQETDCQMTEEQRRENLEEQPFIDGYDLDIDSFVCNELLLNLPMKVLCREDCKGLCSKCGANLNLHPCTCDRTSLDPRMAAIQDIFKQFNQEN